MAKTKSGNRLQLVLSVVVCALVLCVGVLGVRVRQIEQDSKQQGLLQLRGLIETANSALEKPVPVDPKTGAVYLYQVGLTLPPVPDSLVGLEYSYLPSEGVGLTSELHLSSQAAINDARARLAAATNQQELFAAVPGLQACTRGITLSFSPLTGRTEALPSQTLSRQGQS